MLDFIDLTKRIFEGATITIAEKKLSQLGRKT